MILRIISKGSWMLPILLVIVLLIYSTFLKASPPQSEDSKADYKLLANGSLQHSPVTQAMLYDESEIRQAWLKQNKKVAKEIEERIKKLHKDGVPKNITDTQRAQAIVDWTEALNRAHATYVHKSRVVADAKEANSLLTGNFVSYLEIFVPGKMWKNAVGPINSTSAKLGSGAFTMWIEERMDRFMNAGTEHKTSVNNAVELALYFANSEYINKWAERWQNQSPTDAELQEATRELLPGSGDFFKNGPGAELSRDSQAEIQSVQNEALKDAVLRVATKRSGGPSSEKEARKNALSNFDQAKLDKSSKDIRDFRKSFTIQANALEKFAESTKTQLMQLKDQVSGVDTKIDAIQLTMWRQMGPRERLSALQDGFLPLAKNATTEQIKKRQDDIVELQKTAKILDQRDELLNKLDGLSAFGKFAAIIGVPIDTYNFNRNIAIASSVVNAFSSFAMGNTFGAFQQLGGVFGAGGEDPNVAQFNQVNKKLDLIIEKLEEINKNIYLLSEQVAHGFQGLHERLEIMEEKIEFSNMIGGQLILDQGYQACRQFVHSAMKNGMQNGLYPNYAARKRHFDEDYSSGAFFKNCRNYLPSLIEVTPKNRSFGIDAGTQAVTRLELLASTYNPKSVGTDNSRTKQLDEMWMATMFALGWIDHEGAPRINCMRRGLAFLATGSRKYSEILANDLHCNDSDLPSDKVKGLQITWKNPGATNLVELDVHDAMQNALSPGAVRHFGEIILFVAPFTELARPVALRPDLYELPSLSVLSDNKRVISPTASHFRDWPYHYSDVVNLAIAQQTVMSGIFIAKFIAKELKSQKFYASYVFHKVDEHGNVINKTIKDNAGKDMVVPVTIAESEKINSSKSCNVSLDTWKENNRGLVILCLLKRYPELAYNVVNVLVREELMNTQASKPVYAFALEARDDSHIRHLLPSFADVITRNNKNNTWGINLRDETGEKNTMDECNKNEIDSGVCTEDEKAINRINLPKATALWSDIGIYPYIAEQLFDLRDLIEERVTALQAHEVVLKKHDTKLEWVVRRSSASVRSLVEVPFTTFLQPADVVTNMMAPSLN